MDAQIRILDHFDRNADAVIFPGSCLELLTQIPESTMQLVVTSPPYNLGKEYERRQSLEAYLDFQETVIRECVRVLKDTGSEIASIQWT